MTIRDDARQEAERRYPALNPDAEELTYPRSAIRRMTRGAFEAGAVWASEQADREPSEVNFCDQCAGPYPLDSWPGSQYAGHWDTCPNRHHAAPVGHPSDAEVEAAGEAIWGRGWRVPKEVVRAALLAAQEVRDES